MKIVVGTKNPVKIQAVEEAFNAVFPQKEITVSGIEVSSGVTNQPMSDKETIIGATARAKNALVKVPDADFSVGLEGGLQEVENRWFDCGWVVVLNVKGEQGIGSTIRLETSKKMIELIRSGKELGEVNDILFSKKNSKHENGHFGLMTNNAITRIQGYRDGVISALSYFLHPEVFP